MYYRGDLKHYAVLDTCIISVSDESYEIHDKDTVNLTRLETCTKDEFFITLDDFEYNQKQKRHELYSMLRIP